MIPPGFWDLAPLIPISAIGVWGFLRLVHSPIGGALAERLRGAKRPQPDDAAELDDLRSEVASLRTEVSELHERLDFAERLLLQPRRADHPDAVDTPTPV